MRALGSPSRTAAWGDAAGKPGEDYPDAAVAALQDTLAAEHAAVYVYGALGARVSRSASPELSARLVAAYRIHQARRDELLVMLADAGVEPAAPPAGYDLPGLDSGERIERRARRLETDAATTYAFLVASTTGAARRWAAEALSDAAVRGVTFGAAREPLPGV